MDIKPNNMSTREQQINQLNKLIDLIPMEETDREVLIKQIAMVRVKDMNLANETDGILKFKLDIMEGAANGKIA